MAVAIAEDGFTLRLGSAPGIARAPGQHPGGRPRHPGRTGRRLRHRRGLCQHRRGHARPAPRGRQRSAGRCPAGHDRRQPRNGTPLSSRHLAEICAAGGEEEAEERCREVFAAFATHVVTMGPVGTGQAANLSNNALLILNQAAIVRLASDGGTDPQMSMKGASNVKLPDSPPTSSEAHRGERPGRHWRTPRQAHRPAQDLILTPHRSKPPRTSQ